MSENIFSLDIPKVRLGGALLDKYDLYDHDKLKRLYEEYCKKGTQIYKRLISAKTKGDKEKTEKALKALREHKKTGEIMKDLAKKTGFYWY